MYMWKYLLGFVFFSGGLLLCGGLPVSQLLKAVPVLVEEACGQHFCSFAFHWSLQLPFRFI